MSPLRAGSASRTVPAEDLLRGTAALERALLSGGRELPQAERGKAEAVIAKASARLGLVGGHTVVALAGATGSGKSSLFNALVGADVATVGARRPTTSNPTAAVWGDEPADPLLEWLKVQRRHHVTSSEPVHGTLDGLVLLDLPDFDSRESSHRAEAERILELVDLFVWVTDPQKYADARLHDDYVATLATHESVTVAVLNHTDRLSADEVALCVTDLKRLLALDGVPGAQVLATSARTGAGVDELRQRLANIVAGANAARVRLAGDIRSVAEGMRHTVATSEPTVDGREQSGLVDALARSAGVPTVVEAVGRDYRMAAAQVTGWPFTRWVHQLRPKPLRRLRLDGDDIRVSEADVRSVLGRSSLPPPTPAARAAVTLATRQLADRTGGGLPTPWADAVEDAAVPAGADLTDALDRAVVGTPMRARTPLWWRVVGWLQIVLAACAAVGLLWYLLVMVLSWLQFSELPMPRYGPVPAPFILLVGGLLGGLLLALLAAAMARIGARREAARVDGRLRGAIAGVAQERIVDPVNAVLARHRETREAIAEAAAL